MKKKSLQYLLIIIVLIAFPMKLKAQPVELCGGSTLVMEGEYNIMNNVWGAQTPQCIEVYPDSSYFKVSLSEHNNGNDVASYPAIYKGCHWGNCTSKDNPMPIPVREIGSAPFTWSVNTEEASGTWNTALDIWFAELGTGFDYSAELMIWIDYNGGAAPAGSRQETIEIGGLSWDVHFAAWSSWNYIAYKIISPVDSVNLDLRDFIHDAVSRGYIYTPWYLHAIEAGFEIWSDGQGLTTHSFSADVIETSTPINYPPVSFRIQSPPDGSTVDTTTVTFRWQRTIDPDLETVEYILHLNGPTGDTIVTGLDTNTFVFDGANYFQPNTTYTWYVEATDNIDTTVSTTQRTFTTPVSVGVNPEPGLPERFFLYQNFPNPFNPDTKISFALKSSGKVRLSVLDLLGQEVAILTNDFLNAGLHEVNFSATDLPSGIYFYKLQTKEGIIVKKMTLLR
jgi:hypothetical protein